MGYFVISQLIILISDYKLRYCQNSSGNDFIHDCPYLYRNIGKSTSLTLLLLSKEAIEASSNIT